MDKQEEVLQVDSHDGRSLGEEEDLLRIDDEEEGREEACAGRDQVLHYEVGVLMEEIHNEEEGVLAAAVALVVVAFLLVVEEVLHSFLASVDPIRTYHHRLLLLVDRNNLPLHLPSHHHDQVHLFDSDKAVEVPCFLLEDPLDLSLVLFSLQLHLDDYILLLYHSLDLPLLLLHHHALRFLLAVFLPFLSALLLQPLLLLVVVVDQVMRLPLKLQE